MVRLVLGFGEKVIHSPGGYWGRARAFELGRPKALNEGVSACLRHNLLVGFNASQWISYIVVGRVKWLGGLAQKA